MDNLQKAKALLTDRNINLTEIAKNSDIPYESLKVLRYNPDKIKKASWERVNKLASIYNTRSNSTKNTRKPLIIETNKFVYVEEMDKYFKEGFPKGIMRKDIYGSLNLQKILLIGFLVIL